ncbi:MAG: jacalin-like lectin [Betaproteobacteria bacterium]
MSQRTKVDPVRLPRALGAMFGLIVVLAEAALAADQTTIIGGPGGTAFVDRPPAGVRIGAIAIQAGGWIDSVGVVYETSDGRRYASQRHGGSGGGPCVITLEPDERILAIQGHHGAFIESIQLITTRRQSRICGRPGGAQYRIDVPPNHSVVGFAGRAGLYVDAIGLSLATTKPGGGESAPSVTPPTAAPRPATLASKVDHRSNLDDTTLRFRLTAPAAVQVALGVRKLQPGECFKPGERIIAYKDRPSAVEHQVTFDRLTMNTDYSYAIRIGASTGCESGKLTTATKID